MQLRNQDTFQIQLNFALFAVYLRQGLSVGDSPLLLCMTLMVRVARSPDCGDSLEWANAEFIVHASTYLG